MICAQSDSIRRETAKAKETVMIARSDSVNTLSKS